MPIDAIPRDAILVIVIAVVPRIGAGDCVALVSLWRTIAFSANGFLCLAIAGYACFASADSASTFIGLFGSVPAKRSEDASYFIGRRTYSGGVDSSHSHIRHYAVQRLRHDRNGFHHFRQSF